MSSEPANANNQPVQPPPSSDAQVFKVYKPAQQTNIPPADNLPESYFEPTSAEVMSAQSTLSARTQALVNAPLQLRATREAAEKVKRDRWPNTTIRVRFTDRTQLEKVFPSTDRIRSVYAFVRSSLREDVKPIKFILYQPPRRDLKVSDPKVRDLTLSELQLSPSSVLLLRFEDEALNRSDIHAPLAPAVLSQAIDLPTPPNFDSQESTETPATSPRLLEAKPTTGEKKIPKWLKMGLKK